MFINLHEAGVKRLVKPGADIVCIREYHPEVLRYFDEVVKYHWKNAQHTYWYHVPSRASKRFKY